MCKIKIYSFFIFTDEKAYILLRFLLYTGPFHADNCLQNSGISSILWKVFFHKYLVLSIEMPYFWTFKKGIYHAKKYFINIDWFFLIISKLFIPIKRLVYTLSVISAAAKWWRNMKIMMIIWNFTIIYLTLSSLKDIKVKECWIKREFFMSGKDCVRMRCRRYSPI